MKRLIHFGIHLRCSNLLSTLSAYMFTTSFLFLFRRIWSQMTPMMSPRMPKARTALSAFEWIRGRRGHTAIADIKHEYFMPGALRLGGRGRFGSRWQVIIWNVHCWYDQPVFSSLLIYQSNSLSGQGWSTGCREKVGSTSKGTRERVKSGFHVSYISYIYLKTGLQSPKGYENVDYFSYWCSSRLSAT